MASRALELNNMGAISVRHGGKRRKAGRPKGTTKEVLAEKRTQNPEPIRLVSFKREKMLWNKALLKAEKTGNVDALIRALVHVNEIQRGRPYVAVNPNAAMAPKSDDRLVMAIQNLQIVSQSPSQTGKSQVIETKATPEIEQECLTMSSERDIEAKPNTRESTADHAQIDR